MSETNAGQTERKRGRPKSTMTQAVESMRATWNSTERTELNRLYCLQCIKLNEKEFKPFFVTNYGGFKRQGIAEQIGRIREEGLATDEELTELTRQAIRDYENGQKVKDIEKRLRNVRKVWEEALSGNP